jgi:hypothetical protein
MTTTAMVTAKSTGLAKTTRAVRDLAQRLERARQSRNEKLARADTEYADACKRAIAAMEQSASEPEPEPETTTGHEANA